MDWKKAAKVQARKAEKDEVKQAKQAARAAAKPDRVIRVSRRASVEIKDGRIYGPTANHGSVALAGATAVVESAGDIDRRVTATRLLMTGPLAFGLRKKKDNRELFVTIEGSDGVFVVNVRPEYEARARRAAAEIATLGKQADASPTDSACAVAGPTSPTEGNVTVELTPEMAAKLARLLAEDESNG